MKKNKPIVALDFPCANQVYQFLDELGETELNVKVGMELFYAEGTVLLKELINRGHHIFLDLKLHDIPNTVERSIEVISQLGCDMINVHALGGRHMMASAVKAAKKSQHPPLVIAVTQLTSTSQQNFNDEQLSSHTLEESVIHLAKLAKESGMDGVVCSPHEVALVKQACGDDFLTVTPGIRLSNSKEDDQVRIMSVKQAKQIGSDYIVVGRPITRAENKKEAYNTILSDWSGEDNV